MPTKDFAPIEDDYNFFMAHATEAQSDLEEYARQLHGFADERGETRLLDFGCGAGQFTEQFLAKMGWPRGRVRLTLVEPVDRQCAEAAGRVARFSASDVAPHRNLDGVRGATFDLILSNHALYYVDDLDDTMRRLLTLVAPGGLMVTAIADWDNALMQLWKRGFASIGRPVPYYAAQDVEASLKRLGAAFQRSQCPYELSFPDDAESRRKILRFLFGEHWAETPHVPLLAEFDPYAAGGAVVIRTHDVHYTVGWGDSGVDGGGA